jgi:hypothetical protein
MIRFKHRIHPAAILWMALTVVLVNTGCSTQSAVDNISGKAPSRAADIVLPRAAILATSDGDGLGTFCDGVVLAYEALNRAGIPTQICDRTILADRSRLDDYSIIIASTLYGYHDADQRFSLTFADDDQLESLSEWIIAGGILVAGENFGRNTREGHDRLVDSPELNPETWPLGNAIGVPLTEQNLNGYELFMKADSTEPLIWRTRAKHFIKTPEWILAPAADIAEATVKVLGEWVNSDRRIPAVWESSPGSGRMLYFSTFRLLHPELDGGLSTPVEIENFYQYLANLASGTDEDATIKGISVSPWYRDRSAALAVTVNSTGEEENFERTILSLLEDAPAVTIFTNHPGTVARKLPVDLLNRVEIASLSKSDEQLSFISLQRAKELIHWPSSSDVLIEGFRFPRLSRSGQLFEYIDRAGYTYDSSLPVNHQDYYGGSLYPVNLMLSYQDGSSRLNLLEMGPIFRDDWSFYDRAPGNMIQEAAMYREFLLKAWSDTFLPQSGLMVQIGDPNFEGESEVALEPVKTLIRTALADNAWVTNLSTVAAFWTMRETVMVSLWRTDNNVQILVSGGERNIDGLTLNVAVSEDWSLDNVEASLNGEILKKTAGVVNLICTSGNQSFYSLQY